jgi:hypothetical protein
LQVEGTDEKTEESAGKRDDEGRGPRTSALTRRSFLSGGAATGVLLGLGPLAQASPRPTIPAGIGDGLRREFLTPPDGSKPWVYWWWLDGAASRTGITADLEAMKQQGISGVLLFNAGSGGPLAPKGTPFMGAQWREYFRFAVREAARLGIEMAANLCSGWNCGGPWVTENDAIKDLVWSETVVEGPKRIEHDLARPSGRAAHADSDPGRHPPGEFPGFYRDIAVLAHREHGDGVWRRDDTRELTSATDNGRLRWDVPAGRWTVLRLGYVVRRQANQGPIPYGASQVIKDPALQSDGGWEIDPMSAGAMDRHFEHTGAKLIEDAGPLAGKTLKYFHIDSWEIGVVNWTPAFLDEFRRRRGYDPTRYLPALAGKTVDTPEFTTRFMWDYRRTVADLIAQNYYGRLATRCHEYGLRSESESGGPYYSQYIDAMECEGVNDLPMAEFWCSRHKFRRGGKPIPNYEGVSAPFFRSANSSFPALNYGSVRQEVSAAHVYGKPVCQAESYTSFNEDWSEDPDFLKTFGDRAFCLGLTRQVLCFAALQSTTDKPGFEWEHVGTHFDRNVTWFDLSHGWLTYLARCQHMLRQGIFVADILYFSGQAIPNFVLMDRKPIAGFDFDVINAQALLQRAAAADDKAVLPGGLSYRYFVLPKGTAEEVTPEVLRKMRQLVECGMTLIGTRPKHSLGLFGFPGSERDISEQSDALWGPEASESGNRRVGKGRVIWGRSLEDVIREDGLPPDVELRGAAPGAELDWVHRRLGEQDLYFLANLSEQPTQVEGTFRVAGKTPELWDPVTGTVRDLPEFRVDGDRTAIPLEFAPKQSWFLVFRQSAARRSRRSRARNFPALTELTTLSGPWEVGFDEEWGGPASVSFQLLEDWTRRPEDGIRYYSGMATYRKMFDAPRTTGGELYLDLGVVKNVARVRLNDEDLGVVWTSPWRVAVGDVIRKGGNRLEIDIVNLWPNRLIGDGLLPKEQRRTRTNVRLYETPLPEDVDLYHSDPEAEMRRKTGAPPKLLSSGLLGPVKLMREA